MGRHNSLREITKTFLRLGRQSRSPSDPNETTIVAGPREGRQFGAYRIIRRLGSGGMGEVYLAVDTRLERQVALKFLPPELANDQAMLERLQREARATSALNHPNILTIYEVAQIDGEDFIASEYVDGITLRDAIERGPIDAGTALDIASQVASALMAAHSAGIIHRDLKPSNIMIRPDGYVKVIDFGIAKHVAISDQGTSADLSWTRPGSVVGTLDYMSPEQARAEKLDHRTDLWSLGIVLYEMVAHKRPFEGETESHIVVAILDRPLPPVPNEKSLPAGFRGIIQRALAKDRTKRYQTAGEMLADLSRVSQASGLHSAIRSAVVQPVSNDSRTLVIAGGLLAALAVAFAVWWWGFHGRDLIFGPQWFQFESSNRVTFSGDVRLATISPDGAYLAYVSGDLDNETLRTRELRNGSESQPQISTHDCIGLTFSTDSKSVYYVLKDPKDLVGKLYKFRVSEGIPSLVFANIDGPITFSPDGQQFAYRRRSEGKGVTSDSIIVAQTSDSNNGRAVVTLANTQMRGQLAWSPGGDLIAAIVFSGQLNKSTQPVICLFSPDGHLKRRLPSPNFRSLKFPVWLDQGSLLVFSELPQTLKEMNLGQLQISTAQFHQLPSPLLGFDSLSATSDSRTLAAVRLDPRSSAWIADAANLDAARQVIAPTEGIEALSWSESGYLVFPSARSGNVNLWRVNNRGVMQPVPGGRPCVEDQPSGFPGQDGIVYSSNCAEGGDDFNLWSADLRSGSRKPLTSGSNYDCQPDVSPDGKWIYYTSWPSSVPSVWKIPASGGMPVRVSQQQARYPAVSPDGQQIACQIREPDGLWRVAILSTQDGSVRNQFPSLPITSPLRWSPDGSALDYIDSKSNVPNIWRQPLGAGAPRQLTHLSDDGVIYFAWNRNGSKLAYIRGRAESDVVLFHRSSHN